MEKEIFYALSDNSDLKNLYLRNMNEVSEYIETDISDIEPEDREKVEYTIRLILMTQDEFDNLPEYQF